MKGSHIRAKELVASHLVRAQLSDAGLTLAQGATAVKSDELTAIPEVLRVVDLNGAIISNDAIGTQTAIAEQLVDRGGDTQRRRCKKPRSYSGGRSG